MPLVVSLDLHANVTPQMVEHADALIAYRTYPHVDMADTGRAAAKHLALMLQHQAAIRKGVPAIAVPDSDQLAMHQRSADQRHLSKSSRHWKARRCRRCRSRRGFRRRIFRIAGRACSPMAGPRPMPMPRRMQGRRARSKAMRTISTAASISPDEGVRHAMELAKRRTQADHHRRHPGQSRRRRRFRHHRHAARAGAQQGHPGRHRRDLRSAIGQGRACRRRRRHRHAGARRQVRHTRRCAISGNLRRRETVGRKIRRTRPLLWRPRHGHGSVGVPADRRCQGGREFAQGAARGSVDVSLCRHRADRAGHPGQQELGAFPRRLRADRREAADLRRARRDAGRYRSAALDAAASGHPHQAERRCLHTARQSRSTSSATG